MEPSREDLTARARIRDAALEHFTRDGFARATVRDIARTAGVSPGLMRHHFGSKEELRQACDEYVLAGLRRAGEQSAGDSAAANPLLVGRQILPFQRYVARALLDGSAAASRFFDEVVALTEKWLAHADESREKAPYGDRRARAALLIAMRMGVPLLHEHLSRALDTDVFGPEGDRRIILAMLDIHSHPMISPETAAAVDAMLTGKSQHPEAGPG
jgi:AcrR family transcriptional regulator